MKINEVVVGETYWMRNHSSGKHIQIRIVREKPTRLYGGRGGDRLMTHWQAINLKTGRLIEVKSASKLDRVS
jgi:hypothetical protein